MRISTPNTTVPAKKHDSDRGADQRSPIQGLVAVDGKQGLSRRRFCHRYDIGLTTFHELVKRGDLSIHKIGRRTFIDADEAERWWASCAKGPR